MKKEKVGKVVHLSEVIERIDSILRSTEIGRYFYLHSGDTEIIEALKKLKEEQERKLEAL